MLTDRQSRNTKQASHHVEMLSRCGTRNVKSIFGREFLPNAADARLRKLSHFRPYYILPPSLPGEISSCRLDIFSSGAERCLPLLARSQRSKFIPHLLSHCARLNVQVYRPFTPGTGVRCPTFGSTCPGIAACASSCFGSSDALFPVIRLSSTGDTVSLHLLSG